MKRFEEIADKCYQQFKENNASKDYYSAKASGYDSALTDLLEALKPELELMLREQAKIVRHEAITAVQGVIPDQQIYTDVMRVITNLQHPWVNLDEGAG